MVSKFFRLKLRDRLERCLQTLPVEDLEEDQVGDFVYSGSGRMVVGTSYAPTRVRVRMVDDVPTLYVKVPSRGISIALPLEGEGTAEAVRREAQRALS